MCRWLRMWIRQDNAGTKENSRDATTTSAHFGLWKRLPLLHWTVQPQKTLAKPTLFQVQIQSPKTDGCLLSALYSAITKISSCWVNTTSR